jgi:hypothetical protein
LVAALRRGDQLRTVDVFHLRGIAEVGLANALIALITIPAATIAGDLQTAVRIGGGAVLAYLVIQIPVFALRQRRMSVRVGCLKQWALQPLRSMARPQVLVDVISFCSVPAGVILFGVDHLPGH